MSKGYINYNVASMVYIELQLGRKVDWSMYPPMRGLTLLIGMEQKNIPDLYDPKAKLEIVLKNTTMLAKKVETVKEDVGPSRSTNPSSKLINIVAANVEGEVFLIAPMCSTPNVIEESIHANLLEPVKDIEAPSMLHNEVNSPQVAEAYATIDNVLDTNVLDPLTYVAPRHSSPRMSSPTISMRIKVHLPSRAGKQLFKVETNVKFQCSETKMHRVHTSTTSIDTLEVLHNMLAREDLEKLYECSCWWTTVVEHPLQPKMTDTPSTSNLNKRASIWENLA